jgi:integrase
VRSYIVGRKEAGAFPATINSVPINSEARAALVDQSRFRAEHGRDSPQVFCHKDGTQVQDVKGAGILDVRIHDLCHTCAAWLVIAGMPLAEVRDLLGHKTIQMTERYAHLAPENLRMAVGQLEAESQSSHAVKLDVIDDAARH